MAADHRILRKDVPDVIEAIPFLFAFAIGLSGTLALLAWRDKER